MFWIVRPVAMSRPAALCLLAAGMIRAAIIPFPMASPPPPQDPLEGVIKVTLTTRKTLTDENDAQRRRVITIDRAATQNVRLDGANAFPGNPQDVVVLRGRVTTAGAHVHDSDISGSPDDESSEPVRLDGVTQVDCSGGSSASSGVLCAEGSVHLTIVQAEHAYYLSFNDVVVHAVATPPHLSTEPFEITIPGFEVGPIPLPEAGAPYQGSRTLDPSSPRPELRKRRGNDPTSLGGSNYLGVSPFGFFEAGSVDAVVSWSIAPPKDIEITLTSSEYNTWMPKGLLEDYQTPGASIKFTAKAHRRGQPDKTSDKPVKLSVEFESVSAEPGVCLNWPDPPPGGDDLQLLAAENPAFDVEEPASATTKRAVKEATITVSSFDFGAWGRLRVRAETETGESLTVIFRDRKDGIVPIPRDEDGNHVADSFPAQDADGNSDEDREPEGAPGKNGDGLTLYEEYRGFSVNGKHVRTDPGRKDVFFSDQTQTSSRPSGQATAIAKDGIARFRTITELVVHELTEKELGPMRIVNRNRAEGAHIVDQHGVPIVLTSTGDAEAIAATADGAIGPPRTTARVQIPAKARYRFEDELRLSSKYSPAIDDAISTIAHELCHCVGVQHHGDGLGFALWIWRQQPDGSGGFFERPWSDGVGSALEPEQRIRVFREADGVEIIAPGDSGFSSFSGEHGGYNMLIMTKGGEFSGDDNCVMRYAEAPGAYAYLSSRAKDVRFIPDISQNRVGTALCGHKSGAGVNASTHQPEPRAGDANRGHCKQQIVVSDRY